MATLKNRLLVLLAKKEVTYGVDAAPAGVDAIKVTSPKLTPLQGDKVAYEYARPAFGNFPQIHTGVHAMVTFDVPLWGSGTLGTAPPFGKLIKACAFAETVVAVTSVTYKPENPDVATDSITFKWFQDGQRHVLLGARGTFSIKIDSKQLPWLSFTFTGLYVDPASAAMPTSLTGLPTFRVPQPVAFDYTPTATLHGYAGVLKSFNLDVGNTVTHFDNPGERAVEITDRKSSGKITVLAPTLTTKNYFTIAKNNTLGTLKIEHGTASVDKVFVESTGNFVQILDPNYGDDTGRLSIDAGLSFVPGDDPGNDDFEIRFAAT